MKKTDNLKKSTPVYMNAEDKKTITEYAQVKGLTFSLFMVKAALKVTKEKQTLEI